MVEPWASSDVPFRGLEDIVLRGPTSCGWQLVLFFEKLWCNLVIAVAQDAQKLVWIQTAMWPLASRAFMATHHLLTHTLESLNHFIGLQIDIRRNFNIVWAASKHCPYQPHKLAAAKWPSLHPRFLSPFFLMCFLTYYSLKQLKDGSWPLCNWHLENCKPLKDGKNVTDHFNSEILHPCAS